jgi:hypothetical protein
VKHNENIPSAKNKVILMAKPLNTARIEARQATRSDSWKTKRTERDLNKSPIKTNRDGSVNTAYMARVYKQIIYSRLGELGIIGLAAAVTFGTPMLMEMSGNGIDNSAPTGEIHVSVDDSKIVDISVDAKDDRALAGLELTVGNLTYKAPLSGKADSEKFGIDMHSKAPGAYDVTAKITDTAGKSTALRKTFELPNAAPDVEVSVSNDQDNNYRGTAQVSDWDTIVDYCLNKVVDKENKSWQVGGFDIEKQGASIEFGIRDLPNGTYTLEVLCKDKLGKEGKGHADFGVSWDGPNPPPKLESWNIETGKRTLRFWMNATDPGNCIRYVDLEFYNKTSGKLEYKLQMEFCDRKLRIDPEFDFSFLPAGAYEVEPVLTDIVGAATRGSRKDVVLP